MSEIEKIKAAEARLQKLASRLNHGWDMLHPVREKHLKTIRQAVQERWAKKEKNNNQETVKKEEKAKEQKKRVSQQKSATQKKSKSQNNDQSQGY